MFTTQEGSLYFFIEPWTAWTAWHEQQHYNFPTWGFFPFSMQSPTHTPIISIIITIIIIIVAVIPLIILDIKKFWLYFIQFLKQIYSV